MESKEYITLAVATARLSDEYYRCIAKGHSGGPLDGLKLTCTGLGLNYREALDRQIEYLRSVAERSADVVEALSFAEEALSLLERDLKLIEVS
jgi:hypothetical protein